MARWMALAAAAAVATPSAAQDNAKLSARQARAIIEGCAAHATAKRQSHGIAVVDGGGHLVAALRMDSNGAGVMAFSEQKARAAANWGFATSGMAEAAKTTPGFSNAPFVVTVPGGVPVWSADGRVQLGGVGVSGEAPADDAACAEAGIKTAGLGSARSRD